MSNNKERRILIKLSGESLMGDENYGIELKTVDRVAKNIKSLIKQLFIKLSNRLIYSIIPFALWLS